MQHDAQDMTTLLNSLHCSPAALQAHQNARGGNSSKIDAHVHSRCLIAALLLHGRGERATLGDAIAMKKSHEKVA